MEYGIVYLLTNPVMPGLVKIGMTTQEDIDKRMKELYMTGVPFLNRSSIKMPHSYGSRSNVQHTTIQPLNPTSSPLNPTTSKDNIKAQKLKTFLSIIGENGANLKMLMEGMHLRDRKSFVNNYINPNLSDGYIAMLYPEIPNHPMQSYYLTKKGRELLEQL